jgi:hypothetical protein
MENRDHLNYEQGQATEAINQIRGEMKAFIESFKLINRQKPSAISESELKGLSSSLSELKQKLESSKSQPLEAAEPENNILPLILQEIDTLNQSILSLSNKVNEIKKSVSRFGQEAKLENKIEISDVKVVRDNWYIKVKCIDGVEENFRNVTIWEVEGNRPVCSFLLIEPNVTVKKKSDEALFEMNHLVAKIGDRVASNLFLIPKAKIFDINNSNYYNCYTVTMQNLSNQDFTVDIIYSNFKLIASDVVLKALSTTEQDVILDDNGKLFLYLRSQGEIISNAYEIDKSPSEEPDLENLIIDLSENRKNIVRYIKNAYPGTDTGDIIQAIDYYNTDDYRPIFNHLESKGLIKP